MKIKAWVLMEYVIIILMFLLGLTQNVFYALCAFGALSIMVAFMGIERL